MSEYPTTIVTDVAKGIRRLLAAPLDLRQAPLQEGPATEFAVASREHTALFNAYLTELHWAIGLAVPWWNSIVAQRVARGENLQKAIRSSYELRPAGPASRLEVVGVVRSFWLQCVELNTRSPATDRVSPEIFLLEWLSEAGNSLAVMVLAGMPFWPIGFDIDGAFC